MIHSQDVLVRLIYFQLNWCLSQDSEMRNFALSRMISQLRQPNQIITIEARFTCISSHYHHVKANDVCV